MYGVIARAAVLGIVAAPMAAILQRVISVMLDIMTAGQHPAPEIIGYIQAVNEHLLLVYVLSILGMVIGGAVAERGLAGGGV